MRPLKYLLVPLSVTVAFLAASQSGLFSLLKSTAAIGKQSDGAFLLPSSQLLRPWGEQFPIEGRPVDAVFDHTYRQLAILNSRGVWLMDGSSGARLAQIPSRATSYTGLAFRPGDRELWASETTRNGPDGLLIQTLTANGSPDGAPAKLPLSGHPVPAAIAFSPDGARAFVAFSRNNSVAVIDSSARRLEQEIPVGMAPFGLALSPKRNRLYVTNRGGRRPQPGDVTAPSSGSQIVTDASTGATTSGTLSVIRLDTLAVEKEIVAGLAPALLALSPDERTLAVANAHSDSVTLLDTDTLTPHTVRIPTWPDSVIGSQPSAVAFSPDGKRLYVACGGNNAIAVLWPTGKSWKLEGALPTAWFPSSIAIDKEGALRVVSIKGTGNTDNHKGGFNTLSFEGSLSRIPAPLKPQLAAGTREVKAANSPRFESAGGVRNLDSLGIRHVFLIIKENRTYDQVFGDMGKGNGDPKFVMYGRDVTPNQHALADEYVLLDNFHTGGAISFDGHQWLMMAFVSDYVERAFAASPRGYAWNMADALTVSPAGFFWQSAPKPLDVRIYGEFCLPARWDPSTQNVMDINEQEDASWSEYWQAYKQGKWQNLVGCRPGVPALSKWMSPRYPNSTQAIPDQIRAEEFLREFREHEASASLPNLMILTLNQDHTSGTRPGSPTPRAMVADNDYAVGRIVEAVSKSKFWPNSLILITEDDAQNGIDHVDGHRTIALAVGPHIRRGAVDSNFYTHTSMIRTVQDVFRIPARTRFLANARAMTSLFTPTPDPKPFAALPPRIPLDEMNPPLKALNGRRLWAARQSAAMNWAEPDDVPQDVLNRILWWDAKGYDSPYPKPR